MLESNQKKTKLLERGKEMEINKVGEKKKVKMEEDAIFSSSFSVCFPGWVNIVCNRRHSQMEDF